MGEMSLGRFLALVQRVMTHLSLVAVRPVGTLEGLPVPDTPSRLLKYFMQNPALI